MSVKGKVSECGTCAWGGSHVLGGSGFHDVQVTCERKESLTEAAVADDATHLLPQVLILDSTHP